MVIQSHFTAKEGLTIWKPLLFYEEKTAKIIMFVQESR